MKKDKRLLLCLFSQLLILHVFTQDYVINFTGSGAATTVEVVNIQNLNTGDLVTINGSDLLHLTGSYGVNSVSDYYSIRLFPNPVNDFSFLEIFSNKNTSMALNLYDINGRVIYNNSFDILQGCNTLQLTGLKKGLYLLCASTADWHNSTKLIVINSSLSSPSVTLKNTENNQSVSMFLKDSKGTVYMPYTDGDILLFKGTSGNYLGVLMLTPESSQTVNFHFVPCVDGDGNHYSVITIGAQTWMAENLNYAVSGSWCYSLIPANCVERGRLYNWYAAMNGENSSNDNPSGVQGVCPDGWHLPSHAEWTELEMYLISNGYNYDGTTYGNKIGKAMASTRLWTQNSNIGAVGNDLSKNNKSGFSVLPNGFRSTNGMFYTQNVRAFWWSSTEYSTMNAWPRSMMFDSTGFYISNFREKALGYSIRCLLDN